ncbi:hypothetical protein K1719_018510 [Acacia pycnantha]|nr:hypothetical protein K1719_018510 [Acacia pycnantha]
MSISTLEQQMSMSMKEIVMDGDTPNLPQEIIINILKRLPVKSLIRFKCVCKDWKNLFKAPYFMAEQFNHSTQQNPYLIFNRSGYNCGDPGQLCLINGDLQVLEHQIPVFTYTSLGSSTIVHSSNGLLCLELVGSYFVWNPAIREFCRVPQPHSLRYIEYTYVGFGFSSVVNDYKIVKLFYSPFNDRQVHTVNVFSLSTRSWKEVEIGKLKGIFPIVVRYGFTFDGAIFWFGTKKGVEEGESSSRLIFSFDIAKEVFTLIPYPASAPKSNYSRFTIYESKLAMLSESWLGNLKATQIELWVMEKCMDTFEERWIWTKIYTSNSYPYILDPVTIWRNEIVCFVDTMHGGLEKQLGLCNLHTNVFKTFSIGDCANDCPIWNYAESLILS